MDGNIALLIGFVYIVIFLSGHAYGEITGKVAGFKIGYKEGYEDAEEGYEPDDSNSKSL